KFGIVGIGRSQYNDEDYRKRLLNGLQQFSRRKGEPNGHWDEFSQHVFYLSVAPQLMPDIAKKLGALKICSDTATTRLVFEKPFGHDLRSAHDLNQLLMSMFKEEQIYRIDHYL